MTIPEVSPRATLRQNLVEYFSLEELVLLCDDLGVDAEVIPGREAGKAYWASQIIGYFVHEDRVDDLLKRVAALRPEVEWSYEPGDEELGEDEYLEPTRRPLLTRKRVAGLILGGLALAVALGLMAWSARMNGLFNVVVADFGQREADGRVLPSQDGQRLAQLMYEALETEFNSLDTTSAQVFKPLVWRRGLVRNEKEAEALAKRIGADVVIYGVLEPAQSTATFTPSFYVSTYRNEADEMVGRHSLSAPIQFRLPLNTVELRAVNVIISYRQKLFANFTLGLMYDVLGRHEQALTILNGTLEDVNTLGQTEGRAVLRFMIGRAHMFLRQTDEAEVAFRAALRENRDYARAYVGLGGVYYQRAERQAPADRISQPAMIDAAFEHYQKALTMAEKEEDEQVAAKARLGLAYVYQRRGEAYLYVSDWALADADLGQSADLVKSALPAFAEQYRLLAQSYATLGATYQLHAYSRHMAGDVVEARRLYTSAGAAYADCIAQGNLNPNDRVITGPDGIIQVSCRPQQEAVKQALIDLE